MIRRCSYHNSLPSPLYKGRGIKGEGLVNDLRLLSITSGALVIYFNQDQVKGFKKVNGE